MDAIRTQRTVDITVERLRNEILRGTWTAGQLLPPERALSAELGVNRLTLRAALSRLEAEFLISPHQGRGVQVLDWHNHGGLGLLTHLDNPEAITELLTLRRSLAAEAVRQACIHANNEDIDVIQRWEERQRHETDPRRFFEGDLAFTRAMVQASGSLPLKLLFNTMERVFRAHPGLVSRMLRDQDAARASYSALLALIRTREPDLARRAVLQALLPEDIEQLSTLLNA